MESSGAAKLASRKLFLWWMGMENSGLEQILERKYPCYGTIFPLTGTAASPDCNVAVQCGATRYCTNCMAAIQMIGQAWEMHAMTDAVASWLLRTCLHWGGKDNASEGFYQLKQSMVHRCSDQCPLGLQT